MLEQELLANYRSLKMCRRFYTISMFAYAFFIVGYLLVAVFIMLGTVIQHDALFLVFDAVVFCPLAFFLAMRGCIFKNDFGALMLPICLAANQIILGIARKYVNGVMFVFFSFRSVDYCFWIHFVVFVVCGVLAVINLFVNRKFRWLEQQVGYPYFNIRYIEQNIDSQQNKIGRAFQSEYERMKRTETDQMSDISTAVPQNDLCGTHKE